LMNTPTARRIHLAAAILSGCALPLTALAVLLLLNPYALLLSASFSIQNQTSETVHVTPMGGLRMASGEHVLRVLPQLELPFLAAPALRQTHIAVPSGRAVSIRANFDDISLGFIAVRTSKGEEKALLVDLNATRGGCCYPPKERTIVVLDEKLVAANESIIAAVKKAEGGMESRLWWWYGLTAGGLLAGVVFLYSLARYRKLRSLAAP